MYQLAVRLLHVGRWWPLFVLAIYTAVFVWGMQGFLIYTSPGVLLGVVTLPIVTVFDGKQKGSSRFFYVAVITLLLYELQPAHFFLYLSLSAAFLFWAEMYMGRINVLPLITILLMAPVIDLMFNIFSFPIRLELTAWAGKVLSLTGQQTTVQGNVISLHGNVFSVDAACMGLNMVVTSLLAGIALLGFYQKKLQRTLPVYLVVLLLLCIGVLNLLTNLIRIICLVQFSLLPETIGHEAIGLFCFVGYIILPLLWISRRMVSRYGKDVKITKPIYRRRAVMPLLLQHGILVLAMLPVCFTKHSVGIRYSSASIPGFHRQLLGDVLKLDNEHTLIYIKRIPAAWYPEHHPMVCWKGSGYTFSNISQQTVAGKEMYTAQLKNGDNKATILYTAWWYDNGDDATISQWHWRTQMLKGASGYSLVNITASSQEALAQEIHIILSSQTLRPVLTKN
jgi:exosortase N